jgi:chondroitin AC lyase
MLSTRMINAELINDEGPRSQHLSDGANFLYLEGDEYLDVFPVWDWNKVPGTTVERTDFRREEIRVKGKTTFVGGVSDGTYGLAAHDLVRGKLAARKFWAFFDDSYICLGAGITCDSEHPVATSVNQCLLSGKVAEGDTWLHHANVGYVFPAGRANVKLSAGPQEGRWSDIGTGSKDLVRKDVFNLWIDHGVGPKDAAYVYEVIPLASAGQTAERAKSSPVQVLSNTADLQAVYHAKLDLLAVAFWKPGRVKDVEVDRPCLVLLRGGKLSIANPTHEAAAVKVTIQGKPIDVKLPDDGSGVIVATP